MREYRVEDHAWRLWRARGGNTEALPPAFVTALGDLGAATTWRCRRRSQPFIDAAISKTVNVPEDYPFEDFENLYLDAWRVGLKGITTYRPNNVLGAVLSVENEAPQDLDQSEPDRRIRDQRRAAGGAGGAALAAPAEARRAARRPGPTWSRRRGNRFAVFVGHVENGGSRTRSRSGSTASRRRAGWRRWPRTCRWTCARRTAPG